MLRLLFSIFLSNGLIYTNVNAVNVQTRVSNYFESSSSKTFFDQWKNFRKPIENSIELVIKETFGDQSMNVYVKKTKNSDRLSEGFFVSDNIVNVLFKDLYLTQPPRLRTPQVSFALASHVLRVDAFLSKVFVDTQYQLFRNLSDVVYQSEQDDPYQTSPFSRQEVQSAGEAAIVVEGCFLTGYAIASLHGESVSLGHDTFRLTNCKFTVEISSPGTGSPPVIAPYFSQDQGEELELLLLAAIREELLPKLQGAMFSYVNTSAIFRDQLPDIRAQQQLLFKNTFEFLNRVVMKQNALTVGKNGGFGQLEDEQFSWTDKFDGQVNTIEVAINNVTVSGLDSAYSAHSGGPYRIPDSKVDDTIRFGDVQVRGSISVKVNESESNYIFYGDVMDTTFRVTINVDMMQRTSRRAGDEDMKTLSVIGWRDLDLHVPSIPLISSNALVTGYLLKRLPKFLAEKLSSSFNDAVSEAITNNEDPINNNDNKHNNNDDNKHNDEPIKPDNHHGNDPEPIINNNNPNLMFNKPMFADIPAENVGTAVNKGEAPVEVYENGKLVPNRPSNNENNNDDNKHNTNDDPNKPDEHHGNDPEPIVNNNNPNLLFNRPMFDDVPVENVGTAVNEGEAPVEVYENGKLVENPASNDQNNDHNDKPHNNDGPEKPDEHHGNEPEPIINTNNPNSMFNRPMFADVPIENVGIAVNKGEAPVEVYENGKLVQNQPSNNENSGEGTKGKNNDAGDNDQNRNNEQGKDRLHNNLMFEKPMFADSDNDEDQDNTKKLKNHKDGGNEGGNDHEKNYSGQDADNNGSSKQNLANNEQLDKTFNEPMFANIPVETVGIAVKKDEAPVEVYENGKLVQGQIMNEKPEDGDEVPNYDNAKDRPKNIGNDDGKTDDRDAQHNQDIFNNQNIKNNVKGNRLKHNGMSGIMFNEPMFANVDNNGQKDQVIDENNDMEKKSEDSKKYNNQNIANGQVGDNNKDRLTNSHKLMFGEPMFSDKARKFAIKVKNEYFSDDDSDLNSAKKLKDRNIKDDDKNLSDDDISQKDDNKQDKDNVHSKTRMSNNEKFEQDRANILRTKNSDNDPLPNVKIGNAFGINANKPQKKQFIQILSTKSKKKSFNKLNVSNDAVKIKNTNINRGDSQGIARKAPSVRNKRRRQEHVGHLRRNRPTQRSQSHLSDNEIHSE